MSLKATWFRDKLRKKAKQGFRGYSCYPSRSSPPQREARKACRQRLDLGWRE